MQTSLTENDVISLLKKLGYLNPKSKYSIRKDRHGKIYQFVNEKTRVPVLILEKPNNSDEKDITVVLKKRTTGIWENKTFPKDFYTEPDEMGYQFYLAHFEEHEDVAVWFSNDLIYKNVVI